MGTLFDAPEEPAGRPPAGDLPLAARMRPRTLEEFVGQQHLLGPSSALRTAIQSGEPHSMILYGPPGTGKTTLARMLAEYADAAFEELSAVEAGGGGGGGGIPPPPPGPRARPPTHFFLGRNPPLHKTPPGAPLPGAGGGRVGVG